MGRVDIKEDAGNHDSFLLQKLFEESLYVRVIRTVFSVKEKGEYQSIVERCRQFLEVEPDVESASGRALDVQVKFVEACKDVITLLLKMFLEGDFLHSDMSRIEEGDSG